MSEKTIRVTIEYDGKTEVFLGYSLVGNLVVLPKDAPVQGVNQLNYGRLSVGDFCSSLVAVVKGAREAGRRDGKPPQMVEAVLQHAIREALK